MDVLPLTSVAGWAGGITPTRRPWSSGRSAGAVAMLRRTRRGDRAWRRWLARRRPAPG